MLALLFQRALDAGDVVGQVVGEEGHGIEAESVHRQVVEEPPARHRLLRGVGRRDLAEVEEHDHAAVEQQGHARHDEAGPPPQQGRGHGDDDEVEERERTGSAAQEVDEAGDQHQVADELDVGLDRGAAPQQPHQGDVDQGRDAGDAAQEAEDVAGHHLGLGGRRLARPGGRPHERRVRLRGRGRGEHPDLDQQVGQEHADDGHHADGRIPAELIHQRSHSEGRSRSGEAAPAMDPALNLTRSSTGSSRGAGTWQPRWCR